MLVMREMNDEDQRTLESGLHNFDVLETNVDFNKKISYGYYDEENNLVAGITAKLEAYKVMYIETLFVSEKYRKHGFGKALISYMEERAKFEGVNVIRLDTFSWQGRDFYLQLGYSIIASYELSDEKYEYFMMKKI
ncbi:GNAT family N-acetyltransferase [Haploplasma modicum]|uniref:GNAT family N-acetyltransferase n=1 Tax=Haploplasma modicum TaxID=2150 RepID=UPI00214AA226|nr:GNAT family N-acetyltransferase [Haploplasma modicum]MCR1809253.1 GNAT family N-acetyltransferase [Haploplasma modicum]